ncbi:MAG: glycoside hydrolase family 15 protein [Trebonia sp.]
MSLRATSSATPSDDLRDLAAFSRDLIVGHQAASGAFPAAPTYPVYRYSWFRDGAFVADGLSRAGAVESADAFHAWCAAVVLEREAIVDDVVRRLRAGASVFRDEFLPTRYTLDGDDGAEQWENFQTDGYGSWLWALWQHLSRHGSDGSPYRRAVGVTTRYLSAVWAQPCYDWWEEHPDEHHVSSLGSIAAGLDAALRMNLLDPDTSVAAAAALHGVREEILRAGIVGGHAVKWIGSPAVDGSLLACVAPFGVLDPSTAVATLAAVDRDLVVDLGVYRYLDDTFYGGGRWPVLAAFRGLALLSTGRRDEALATLKWIASTATPEGYLPEQVGPKLLHPSRHAEWVERWGPVATPLLWSHGMFLMLAHALGIWA